jgi:hypothetical protein
VLGKHRDSSSVDSTWVSHFCALSPYFVHDSTFLLTLGVLCEVLVFISMVFRNAILKLAAFF